MARWCGVRWTAHGRAFTNYTAQTGRGEAGRGRRGMLGLFGEPWAASSSRMGAKSPTGGVDRYVLFGLLILMINIENLANFIYAYAFL